MSYRSEFPDFPACDEARELMADGFVDHSWHNDMCPSFHDAHDVIVVWIDYADPAQRELGGPRFGMTDTGVLSGDAPARPIVAYSGDDWVECQISIASALLILTEPRALAAGTLHGPYAGRI